MKPNPSTQPITIPDEALEALAVDGSVTLIARPPPGLPEGRWLEWALTAFEPRVEVIDVLPEIVDGERLAKVYAGDLCTDDGEVPETFRVPVPTSRVTLSLTPKPAPPGRLNRSRRIEWIATSEGSFPKSEPRPPPPNNRTKPVRVKEATADRLARFARERKVTIAALVEHAVNTVYH